MDKELLKLKRIYIAVTIFLVTAMLAGEALLTYRGVI